MDTFFEFIYYIGIIAMISMFNVQEPAQAADFNSITHNQQYQTESYTSIKMAAMNARRIGECDEF